MAIPLVGSASRTRTAFPIGHHLLKGDSATFATSIGSWLESGSGTLVWDSTPSKALPNHTGSAKFTTGGGSQYAYLSLAGTFQLGKVYHARIALYVEETTVLALPPRLDLGFGTWSGGDYVTQQAFVGGRHSRGTGNGDGYVYYLIRWVPAGNRTSVQIRLTRTYQTPVDPSDVLTIHIGDCRVMEVPSGSMGLRFVPEEKELWGTANPHAITSPLGWGDLKIGAGPHSVESSGLVLGYDGAVLSRSGDNEFGIQPGYAWLYSIPTDPLLQGSRTGLIDVEVGYNWVGFELGEADDRTAFVSPYQAMSLLDLGPRTYDHLTDGFMRHWYVDSQDGNQVKLADALQSPFTAAGDLLVGTTRTAKIGWDTDYRAKLPIGQDVGAVGWGSAQMAMYCAPWGYLVYMFDPDHLPIGSVDVTYDCWFSQSVSSGSRGFTVRIRRDSYAGAVLVTQTYDGAEGNFTDGHRVHWSGTFEDTSPTTGQYVVTIESTSANSNLLVYSDQVIVYFTADVGGTGERLEKGTDGQMLAVDPSTSLIAWKDRLDYFQWPFYVAGTLATGTDKGVYFQVPNKCAIDEVRVHVGTAPTGSSIIVDVNDDGTTIFTTQGNRPEIAISGTDDTSGAADGGTSVAKDSVLTVDIDQVGSSVPGADLAVFVRGHYIW